ncbi:methyl-CpG-binding domain protein 1-like [Corvus hawaiiensis]|uniref:methyl-CpG-binding domain protein 1-like n=1 Tax=Corvus hawaiiensis TaxID=134902 RepID=UPI0020190CD8|nr:methyl-CpG-binding domain protein 1-like [Corvus hawaiiensis]
MGTPPRRMAEGWSECPALGPGWQRREAFRKSGATSGRSDTYYRSPTGQKFRSKIELRRFLGPGHDLSNFDFKSGLRRPGPSRPRKSPKWRLPAGPLPEPPKIVKKEEVEVEVGGAETDKAPPLPQEAPPASVQGPARIGSGPARIGSGPARIGSGPARIGSGPAPPCAGPAPSGRGPRPLLSRHCFCWLRPRPPQSRPRPLPLRPRPRRSPPSAGPGSGRPPEPPQDGVVAPETRLQPGAAILQAGWAVARARPVASPRTAASAAPAPRNPPGGPSGPGPTPKCLLRRCLRIVKKGLGCGSCAGCLSTEDCGSCCICLRRLQPGLKRQWRCLRRRCLRPKKARAAKKTQSPRPLTEKWKPPVEREPSDASSTRQRKPLTKGKEKKKPGRPPKPPGPRGGAGVSDSPWLRPLPLSPAPSTPGPAPPGAAIRGGGGGGGKP